jgi:hypothetical protein
MGADRHASTMPITLAAFQHSTEPGDLPACLVEDHWSDGEAAVSREIAIRYNNAYRIVTSGADSVYEAATQIAGRSNVILLKIGTKVGYAIFADQTGARFYCIDVKRSLDAITLQPRYIHGIVTD